jgi:6-phosphogluconolactonase
MPPRFRIHLCGRPAVLFLLLMLLEVDAARAQGRAEQHMPANTFLYVSMAPEQQIQVYRLELNGELTGAQTLTVDGTPGSLAVDPQKRFLYASHRSKSKLGSYRIDEATGRLTRLSSAALPEGENAAFVGTDRSGRWLLSASYAAGKVVVH